MKKSVCYILLACFWLQAFAQEKRIHQTLSTASAATLVLLADDVTGIGVADDVAIPFVWIGAGGIITYAIISQVYFDDIEAEVETLPREMSLSEVKIGDYIYRGIPADHKYYFWATQGKAKPFGGNASPFEHHNGRTNSIYTSWTKDFVIAHRYATTSASGGSVNGIILVKNVTKDVSWQLVKSPDMYHEKEILVKDMMEADMIIPVTKSQDINSLYKILIEKGVNIVY